MSSLTYTSSESDSNSNSSSSNDQDSSVNIPLDEWIKKNSKKNPRKKKIEKRKNHKKNDGQKNDKNFRKKNNWFSILVFNLPLNLTPEDVNELFQQFGKIQKINFYWNPGEMRSFNAKIFYKNEEEAKEAKDKLDKAELDRKILKIIFN